MEEEKETWPDFGSIIDCTGSLSISKHSYACSSIHSVKRNEAVAEAAAAQEVWAELGEQEREATELKRLEAEDKKQLAQFESEKLARQQAIQEKHKKLDCLEEVKKLNAARARVKVYDQVEGNSITPFITPSQPVITQTLHASAPPFVPQFLPSTSQAPSPLSLQLKLQVSATSTLMSQVQNSSDLVSPLAEAISANHLPTPEPALFM